MIFVFRRDPRSVVAACFGFSVVWAIANSIYLPVLANTADRIWIMDVGNWLTYKFVMTEPIAAPLAAFLLQPFLNSPELRGVAGIATASGFVFGVAGGLYCVAWSACHSLSQTFEVAWGALRFIKWTLVLLLGIIAIVGLISVREIWHEFELMTASKYAIFTIVGTTIGIAIYAVVAIVASFGIALGQRHLPKKP